MISKWQMTSFGNYTDDLDREILDELRYPHRNHQTPLVCINSTTGKLFYKVLVIILLFVAGALMSCQQDEGGSFHTKEEKMLPWSINLSQFLYANPLQPRHHHNTHQRILTNTCFHTQTTTDQIRRLLLSSSPAAVPVQVRTSHYTVYNERLQYLNSSW